jgi:hypothetical protein
MEFINLLDVLEEIIRKGTKVPLSDRCIVDKVEALELIREIRLKLPEEIKASKRVWDERERLISEAQRQAATIIRDAEVKGKQLIDNNEIVRQAEIIARDTVDTSQKKAREIRLGSREYVDGVLEDLEKFLKDNLGEVQANRQSLK